MRYFIDSEFIESSKSIDLISIGIVREDGKYYYAVSKEFNLSKACDWVKAHVVPQLLPPRCRKSRAVIKQELLDFLSEDPSPEFWADYASYDWVVFCKLFGTMMDLPERFPMFCRDIQQYRGDINIFHINSFKPHHALYDAFECRARWIFITQALKPDKTV